MTKEDCVELSWGDKKIKIPTKFSLGANFIIIMVGLCIFLYFFPNYAINIFGSSDITSLMKYVMVVPVLVFGIGMIAVMIAYLVTIIKRSLKK